MSGWIKLHRSIKDRPEIFQDREMLQLWIYLLINAAYEDYEKKGPNGLVIVKRGSLIKSRKVISEELKIPEKRVRTLTDRLAKSQRITRRNMRSMGTVISICDYDKYQDDANLNHQTSVRVMTKGTSKGPPQTRLHNKNKEIRKKNYPSKDGSQSSGEDVTQIAEIWNRVMDEPFSQVRPTSKVSRRSKSLTARWKEKPDAKYWEEVIQRIKKSDFCRGQSERGWIANIDFLARSDSHVKVMEGKYDSSGSQSKLDVEEMLKQIEAEKNGHSTRRL